MFCFIITAQEIADYEADMLEMAGEHTFPTDEEMEEMFKWKPTKFWTAKLMNKQPQPLKSSLLPARL